MQLKEDSGARAYRRRSLHKAGNSLLFVKRLSQYVMRFAFMSTSMTVQWNCVSTEATEEEEGHSTSGYGCTHGAREDKCMGSCSDTHVGVS